jgi:hypothetical protein
LLQFLYWIIISHAGAYYFVHYKCVGGGCKATRA